ncbi:MAG: hypothetical protein VR73_12880 [Gammaproteobacteria bacterium BRH_c0]|nr:MAG: hypothetical protein VR73_12880 [Gammaproteobacteria bacterium BRH_c0]
MNNDIINGVNIGDAINDLQIIPESNVFSGQGRITGSTGFGADFTDWFVYIPERDGTLTLYLHGLSADLDLVVYDNTSTELDYSANEGTQPDRIVLAVAGNTPYLINVTAFSNGSNYLLNADFVGGSPPSGSEGRKDSVNGMGIGDAPARWELAHHITLNNLGDAWVTGSTGFHTDSRDWYSFEATESGIATFQLTDLGDDLDLFLYDPYGNLVSFSVNEGAADDRITYEVVAGQRYHLEVDSYLQGSNYSLAIDLPKIADAQVGLETINGRAPADAGETLATAIHAGWNMASAAVIVGGTGLGADTTDWFTFVAPANGRVDLRFSGATDTLTFNAYDGTAAPLSLTLEEGADYREYGFDVRAGQTYYFQLGSLDGEQSYIVNMQLPQAEQAALIPQPGYGQGINTTGEFHNFRAFALLKNDGSVVSWGDGTYGGSSYPVSSDLTSGVVKVFSSDNGFAALKSDGTVVTWGAFSYPGGYADISEQIGGDVVRIFSNYFSFAGLRADGSVVTWGNEMFGGFSSHIADQLAWGVREIYATTSSFAALKQNGSVVTWGDYWSGGDSSAVADQLTEGVVSIIAGASAFTALKTDGSVVVWGSEYQGANINLVADQLESGVVEIITTGEAFAAIKEDGSVVSWGSFGSFLTAPEIDWAMRGGVKEVVGSAEAFAALLHDGSVVVWGSLFYAYQADQLATELAGGVVEIVANSYAFAALKSDGSVVTWGQSDYGGDSTAVAGQLTGGVERIITAPRGFVALTSDGAAVVWGNGLEEETSLVAAQLASGVIDVLPANGIFAALKADGSVVTWGRFQGDRGPDQVADDLASGVVKLVTNGYAFAAIKDDGSVVVWGENSWGGQAYEAAEQLTSGALEVNSIYSNNYYRQGSDGDDLIIGYGGANIIHAHGGNDRIYGGPLDDFIDGGAGDRDTLLAFHLPSQYVYQDGVLSGAEGIDQLVSIEFIGFGFNYNDERFAVLVRPEDLVETAGPGSSNVTRILEGICDLYIAYFDRAPEPEGLLYWFKNIYEGGAGLDDLSRSFADQIEYRQTYPEGLNNREFVEAIYENLFDREPDQTGWDYWINDLDQGLMARETFIFSVIEGAYATSGSADDRQLLNHKHNASLYYVEQLSLHPEELFDAGISAILNNVTWEADSVSIAKEIVDQAMQTPQTITDIVQDPVFWSGFWGV